MDGYSEDAMMARCAEDYRWARKFSADAFASERASMMSHLYDNGRLWEHVSMVAFAEHYVLVDDDFGEETAIAKPFVTFQRQREILSPGRIFGGVVLSDWEGLDNNGIEQKLAAFKEKGIDYVRIECNFGLADDIGGTTQLDNPLFSARFGRLAEAAKKCQNQEMVPLVLLQVPWREPGEDSKVYFEKAVKIFARALKKEDVESKRVLFETRPPIGVSAQEEKGLGATARISLGLETGHTIFDVIREAFDGKSIAGFCVAGGSTKGDVPTAMEDDTQNAVRQGVRDCARRYWGYSVCFWEMGAKLMLQPKVGRLWASGPGGRDAARELFCVNAEDLAEEITAAMP